MKARFLLALLAGLSLLAGGCAAKSASLEGSVLNAEGKPIAGVRVIARALTPIRGYEQFDTLTGPDGGFQFSGLHPLSPYVLETWTRAWTSEDRLQVTPPPQGESLKLARPLTIKLAVNHAGSQVMDAVTGTPRFQRDDNGVIKDTVTGLEWVAGPDQDTSPQAALNWVESCKIDGGGWKVPSLEELKTLYCKNVGEANLDEAFRTSGSTVWAFEHVFNVIEPLRPFEPLQERLENDEQITLERTPQRQLPLKRAKKLRFISLYPREYFDFIAGKAGPMKLGLVVDDDEYEGRRVFAVREKGKEIR